MALIGNSKNSLNQAMFGKQLLYLVSVVPLYCTFSSSHINLQMNLQVRLLHIPMKHLHTRPTKAITGTSFQSLSSTCIAFILRITREEVCRRSSSITFHYLKPFLIRYTGHAPTEANAAKSLHKQFHRVHAKAFFLIQTTSNIFDNY